MEIRPTSHPWKTITKLMSGSILQRSIGWISTVNSSGEPNLAPFSLFNMVCANSRTRLFCQMVRSTDGEPKGTLNNIKENEELVVNVVTEELAEQMNLTSMETLPKVDDFKLAGLRTAQLTAVKAPHVAESPIHFECSSVGTVVHTHLDEGVLLGEDKYDLLALRPIDRQAGVTHVRMTNTFHLERPKSQIQAKE